MKKLIAISVFSAFALFAGGCSQKTDVDMLNAHYGAMKNHDNKQVEEVRTKSMSVEKIMTFDCADDSAACGMVKAMAKMIASRTIAEIKHVPFNQPAPKTSVDAQINATDKAAGGIPVLTMGVVAYKNADKDDGDTTITADNGSTVSTNKEEIHSQTTGDNSPPTVSLDKSQSESTEILPEAEEVE